MPVRSVKGFKFAAIAAVGGVFSEIKLSVVPLYCFHTSPPPAPPPDSSPQPIAPRTVDPTSPAPVILRKSRLVNPFETLTLLPPAFLSRRVSIVLLDASPRTVTTIGHSTLR